MKKSKLYNALSSFSAVELNRIEKLILSPYFNTDQRLVLLFQHVTSILKDKDGGNDNEDSRHIWQTIYPDSPYDDKTYRTLNSKLLGLIETFLIQEQLKENPIEESNLLLKAIDERNSKTLENIAVKRAKKLIKIYPFKSSQHYYDRYRMERQLYSLNRVEVSRIGRGKTQNININEILTNLDLFYYGERLKYHCSLLGWKKLIITDLAVQDLDSIIKVILENEEYHKPHVLIYLFIYRTLINPDDEESFNKLIETIDASIDLFSQKEAKYIMDSANNFCLRKINSGDTSYLQRLLELYKTSIKNNVVLVDGVISPWTYMNIVGVALRVKEFKWVKSFILEFREYIPEYYKESLSSLSMAQLAYYEKDYDQVLLELQKVEFREFSLKVNAEVTLIATLYELEEFLVLNDVLKSFNKFLSRSRGVSSGQKDSYKNLIKFVAKLIKPQKAEQLKKLKEEIQNTKGLASKSWLLEKVDELLGEKA